MEASLKFKNLVVEKMLYKSNYEYQESDEKVSYSPNLFYKVLINPGDHNEANVILGVEIGSDSQLPFEVDVVIRGFFSIEDSQVTKETAEKFYSVNALAILFPYLRALVTDLTGRSDHQPLILPLINVTKMAHEAEDHELEK